MANGFFKVRFCHKLDSLVFFQVDREMKLSVRMLSLAVIFNLTFYLMAESLPSREWTSTAGTNLKAEALGIEKGIVRFKAADGRELSVALNLLVPADRKVLREAFPEMATEVPEGQAPEGLPHPQGEIVGPIESSDSSSYYLYLPESMSADTPAPVLFFGGSGGAGRGALQPLITGAELTGMVLAASVENGNSMSNIATIENTKSSISHLKSTLPVDGDRLTFTGGSGGGARTFIQATEFKDHCVGAIPFVGYVPSNHRMSWGKQTYFYIMGGARDFNRYSSAGAAETIGKRAVYRPYPGGHVSPSAEVWNEALIWVYTSDLYLNGNGTEAERKRFEARFLNFLKEDLAEKTHQATFWSDHLLETCDISGPFAGEIETLLAELKEDEKNARYLEAWDAIRKFTKKEYADLAGGSKKKHGSDSIARAAEKIAVKFADVPEVSALAKELGEKTE